MTELSYQNSKSGLSRRVGSDGSTSSRNPKHSSTSSNSGGSGAHMETSVTRLLVATKKLLESLTKWSQQQVTENDVSDIFVKLGNEFSHASRAFGREGINMSDLQGIPDQLRACLEACLSEEANTITLNQHLPKIREIIINLLQGLKGKQQLYRNLAAERRARDSTSSLPSSSSTNATSATPTGTIREETQIPPASSPGISSKTLNGLDRSNTPPPSTQPTTNLEASPRPSFATFPDRRTHGYSRSLNQASRPQRASQSSQTSTPDTESGGVQRGHSLSGASSSDMYSSSTGGGGGEGGIVGGSVSEGIRSRLGGGLPDGPRLKRPERKVGGSGSLEDPNAPSSSNSLSKSRSSSSLRTSSMLTSSSSENLHSQPTIHIQEATLNSQTFNNSVSPPKASKPPPSPEDPPFVPPPFNSIPLPEIIPSSPLFPEGPPSASAPPPSVPSISTPLSPPLPPTSPSLEPKSVAQLNSLAALQKSDLVRRASKRFSAYAIKTLTSGGDKGENAMLASLVGGLGEDGTLGNGGGGDARELLEMGSTRRRGRGEKKEEDVPPVPVMKSKLSGSEASEDSRDNATEVRVGNLETIRRGKRVSTVKEEEGEELDGEEEIVEGGEEMKAEQEDHLKVDQVADEEGKNASSDRTKGSSDLPYKVLPPEDEPLTTKSVPADALKRVSLSDAPVPNFTLASKTVSPSSTIRRGSQRQSQRSSIKPTNTSVSTSDEFPITIFLQLGKEVKKCKLDSTPTNSSLIMLFMEKFSYNPGKENFPTIYLRDEVVGVHYELEDMNEVRDRCLLSLNIEPLDQVKQHIDQGLQTLAQDIKELKLSLASIKRQSFNPNSSTNSATSMELPSPESPRPSESKFQSIAQKVLMLKKEALKRSGSTSELSEASKGDAKAKEKEVEKDEVKAKEKEPDATIKVNGNENHTISKDAAADETQAPSPPPTAVSSTSINELRMSQLVSDLKVNFDEVQNLRRDVGAVRQIYEDFTNETKSMFSSLRSQTENLRRLSSTKIGNSRAFIVAGKTKLDGRTQELLTNIEELQDSIEDLKHDVTVKKIKPTAGNLAQVKRKIQLTLTELNSIEQYISSVKPSWKSTWAEELQNIVEEQQLLNHQEELLKDLKEDHKDFSSVFENIEKYLDLRSAASTADKSGSNVVLNTPRSNSGGFVPPPPKEGHEGLKTVMKEVISINSDSQRRLRAINQAEKAREVQKKEGRGDEFAAELEGFVGSKMLKKTGGTEEVERVRAKKSQIALKAMFNQQQTGNSEINGTGEVSKPEESKGSEDP